MSSFWQTFYYRLHRTATSRAASDENFIKMIFPFQCSCKLNHTYIPWRADLVHVYVTCCGHVYSYKIQYTSSMKAYLIWFSPCIPILNFTCHIYIISYANSPVSLLPLLRVYGLSNGVLFGISGYRWIEILISLNHYNINKSTYLSFIEKSNYRTCWCLWTGTFVVPGHRHPPWRTMAAGTKAVHIAKNHSHASGRELNATG